MGKAPPNGVGLFRQHERCWHRLLRQQLQRDRTIEFGVVSTIHHTRVSPSEFVNDAAVRDGLADHEVGPGLRAEDRTAAGM